MDWPVDEVLLQVVNVVGVAAAVELLLEVLLLRIR